LFFLLFFFWATGTVCGCINRKLNCKQHEKCGSSKNWSIAGRKRSINRNYS